MNSIKFFAVALMAMLSTAVLAQDKTVTFKVSGNCSMCKKTIETAGKTAGVSALTWDTKTKMAKASFDPSKITADSIQKRIAAAGYDTERFAAGNSAYDNLPSCCQYDRKLIPAPAKKH